MAKQASKTVIGVFVVGSIAMLIAAVIIFGSGDLFKERIKFVMFFEDSVKGLAVGAPVIWRGVQVGSVSSIVLQAHTKNLTIDVPVVIEFDPDRIEVEGKRRRQSPRIAEGLDCQRAAGPVGNSELCDRFLHDSTRISSKDPCTVDRSR